MIRTGSNLEDHELEDLAQLQRMNYNAYIVSLGGQ